MVYTVPNGILLVEKGGKVFEVSWYTRRFARTWPDLCCTKEAPQVPRAARRLTLRRNPAAVAIPPNVALTVFLALHLHNGLRILLRRGRSYDLRTTV